MQTRSKIIWGGLGGALATLAAGGIALAAMDTGVGRMGRADADGDGAVTRAEWMATAAARFSNLDRNRDGKLVAAELPRRKGRGHGGRRQRAWDAPPPAPAQPAAAPAQPAPDQQ